MKRESKKKQQISEKPEPGDIVQVDFVKNTYHGTLLESSEPGILLLKLDSGYNLGFKKKEALEIRILKRFKEEKEKSEIKQQSEKPNIAMIITGGTIASTLDPRTGGVHPLTSPEELFRFYPELFEKVNVIKVEIPFMKASEDMDFKDWQKIARTAGKLLNDPKIKGIIITHGTDTLHYTSSALSFFLKNLNKPVVLTYSQRSIDRASSDANLNLRCAAIAALSDIAEVMLVGHATTNDSYCFAMSGTKVRKMHSSERDAFKTINTKPIAKIWPDRIDMADKFKQRNNKTKVKLDTMFEPKVALVKFYPGQDPGILDYYLKKKYHGIVVEATGLGHVSVEGRNSWLKKIKQLHDKGVVICFAAQTIYGRLDPWVYSNARELLKAGVIYLEDMLAETAFVKLGWVLGHKEWAKNKEKVKETMLTNLVGELNNRLTE